MKVLVVGCGYVGLPLAAELAREGHEVWGVNRTSAPATALKAAGVSPLVADITEPKSLDSLPAGWDWVVHCVSASPGGVEEYRRVYCDGTENLLARLAEERVKKFVYTSSTGVYGQDDGSVVEETSDVIPPTETGKILLEAERMLLAAAKRGFPAVILRLAGIYGPGRGYWLRQYLAGSATMERPGTRMLNMIHRDDAIGLIIAALRRSSSGAVYNVVDDEPVSQLAMFQWLAHRLNRELPPFASRSAGQARKRAVTNKIVSNRKARLELGYQFKYPSFREGFAAELEGLNQEDRGCSPERSGP